MILEILIGILGFSVVVLGFTTFNLLNKNEKAEDIIVSYQEHINNLNEEIIKSIIFAPTTNPPTAILATKKNNKVHKSTCELSLNFVMLNMIILQLVNN